MKVKEYILSLNNCSITGISGLLKYKDILNQELKEVKGFSYANSKFKSINFIKTTKGREIAYCVVRDHCVDRKYVTDQIKL